MVKDGVAELKDETRPKWSEDHPFVIEEAAPENFTLDVVYRYLEKERSKNDFFKNKRFFED